MMDYRDTPTATGRHMPVQDAIGRDTWDDLERRCYHARNRCVNERDKDFHRYGGRGIEFRFSDTLAFVMCAYGAGYRSGCGMTIDRIDNDGHYEPGNIRVATQAQQSRNRASVVSTTLFGETASHKCVLEKVRDLGFFMSAAEVQRLCRQGLTGEEIIRRAAQNTFMHAAE